VDAGKVSSKTLLAAAYFMSRAKALGFAVSPFYIKPDMLARAKRLENQHFPQQATSAAGRAVRIAEGAHADFDPGIEQQLPSHIHDNREGASHACSTR
jgi:hypothetical protein